MERAFYRRQRPGREFPYRAPPSSTLTWDSGRQDIIVKNISIYGALVIGSSLPAVGTRVVLSVMGVEIGATIIWAGEDRRGLLLDRSSDQAQTIDLSPVTHPESTHFRAAA